MNIQLQIVLLIGLVASVAYSQSYYSSSMNTCPLGQYPDCQAGGSSNYYYVSTTTSATPVNQTCLACPRGTATFGSSYSYNYYYMNYYGSCQMCGWGYYANKTGETFCTECPEGYYCPSGYDDPISCPKGFSCSKVWNIDSSNYYYYGSNIVKACPQGTYANKRGMAACTTCPAGYSCPDPTAAPVACPKGTASNPYGGYWSYSSGCQSCQLGTYQPKTAAVSCGVCPEGYYCPNPTTARTCPPGTYRNNYIKVTKPRKSDDSNNYYYINPGTKCIPCPAGYYTTSYGSKICTKCPRGYYCADPTASPKPCPAGTFSNLEYGVVSCITCPDGSYTTSTASKTCKICPKGYYCADPAKSPIKCPIGTYSNSNIGQAFCTPCPQGTYASTTGSVQCTPCPVGKCCENPTLNPQPCYFQSTTTPSYQSYQYSSTT